MPSAESLSHVLQFPFPVSCDHRKIRCESVGWWSLMYTKYEWEAEYILYLLRLITVLLFYTPVWMISHLNNRIILSPSANSSSGLVGFRSFSTLQSNVGNESQTLYLRMYMFMLLLKREQMNRANWRQYCCRLVAFRRLAWRLFCIVFTIVIIPSSLCECC